MVRLLRMRIIQIISGFSKSKRFTLIFSLEPRKRASIKSQHHEHGSHYGIYFDSTRFRQVELMASFSASFERSWCSEEGDSFCSSSLGLLDLPSEVLVLILRYLPLSDLANTRLVSHCTCMSIFFVSKI